MLTLFSTTKPFRGYIAAIQWNIQPSGFAQRLTDEGSRRQLDRAQEQLGGFH